MTNSNSLTREIRIRVSDKLYNQLTTIANQRGESKAEVARKILNDNVNNEITSGNIDYVTNEIRKVIRDELKPVEERMAKINAKNAINSGTSMYLNYFVISQAIKELPEPAQTIFEEARKKAVANLKKREDVNDE